VLFLVILLAVTAGGYSMKMTTAHQVTRSRARSWKLLFASRAAVEELKARLWLQAYGGEVVAEAMAREAEIDVVVTEEIPRPITSQGQEGLLAAPLAWKGDIGGVSVEVFFEDEAGKVPINDFAAGSPERSKALALILARLFDSIDLSNSTTLASTIRDFIDTDGEGNRERGARNARIFHISELLAARGFDFDTVYLPRREEFPSAAQCLSTWHTGRININSASATVLAAIAPRLTRSELGAIIVAREERPFASAGDFTARLSISGDAQAQLLEQVGFGTDTLTLYVEARAGSSVRRTKAVIWLESAEVHTLYFGEGWEF
jgi:type II secretory pathway component PulK